MTATYPIHNNYVNVKMIKAGQIYRHYRRGTYKILAVGLNVETQERMVVYQNIDADVVYTDVNNPEKIWIREEKIFNDDVEIDGKTIKRFELID